MSVETVEEVARGAALAAVPTERLEAQLTEFAGHLAAAECRCHTRSRRSRPPQGDEPPAYQVMVHADEDVLTRDSDGRCELDDGPALSPDTARRLLCDHTLVAVLQDSLRRAVRVGTSVDTPARVKRAVRIRDRGCRFPGCRQRRYTDVHHVRWRSRRGGHASATSSNCAGGRQWTILEIGSSMMPAAPASFSAGMRTLISAFATTVSTA
jgi:hypothetical protein